MTGRAGDASVSSPGDGGVPPDFDGLVAEHLDHDIDDDGRARLESLVSGDPRCARAMARAALLHDAIARELVAGELGRSAVHSGSIARLGRRAAVAAALLAAVGGMLWLGLSPRSAVAAERELSRIASVRADVRRVYRIDAGESGDRRGAERRKPDSRGARAKPGIDDALLHLGAPGCYVLERRDAEGQEAVTGCNGQSSWSITGRGAVRTSRSLTRFRGALPGEQHDLPFVDPSEGFARLQGAYDLSLGPSQLRDGREVRSIVAHRRADAARGPKDVTIEYDVESARVLRMEFDRLPQANGGPRSVTLELVGEHPLEPAYFSHEAHHDAGRKVISED